MLLRSAAVPGAAVGRGAPVPLLLLSWELQSLGSVSGFYQLQFLGEGWECSCPCPLHPPFCSVAGLGMLCPPFALSPLVRPPQVSALGFSWPSRRSLCPESPSMGGQGAVGPPERQESDVHWVCAAGSQPCTKVSGNITYWYRIPRLPVWICFFLLCRKGMEIVPEMWQKPESACLG